MKWPQGKAVLSCVLATSLRYAITPRVSRKSAETELKYSLLIDCTNLSGKIGQSLSTVRVIKVQKSKIAISGVELRPKSSKRARNGFKSPLMKEG